MEQHTKSAVDQGSAASNDSSTVRDAAEPVGPEDAPSADKSAAADAEDSPTTPALPLDQTFEILKNQRRRYVLQYLDSAEGSVTLSDLAEQIAAWENDKEVRTITSSERKRVYVGLYQCHLPKMAGMDVIDFNKPRGIIEPGEHTDTFEQYLQPNESPTELSLNSRQIGLSILGIGLLPVAVLLLTQTILAIVATVAAIFLLSGGAIAHLMRRTEPPAVLSGEISA